MRVRSFLIAAAGVFALALSLTSSGDARAGDHGDNAFDLSVTKGQVTVTAKDGWHINKDYPWKLVVGDVKLDRSKFALGATTATVTGAPAGTGKLRGAVCSKDACRMLDKEVSIP